MKVVLITGASSGIGHSVAELLSQRGYRVYGVGRNPKDSPKLWSLMSMDVREEKSIERVVKFIIEKEGKIDILINNAGVGISGSVEEIPMEQYQNIFETNLFGVIRLCKCVLPYMREQKNGLILNTTSIAGYMGLPFRGAYSASKGALMLLSESLSMEVKKWGIEVCNLAPGDVATDIASRRYHHPKNDSSPYAKEYSLSLDMMNQGVDAGQSPDVLARKMIRIIEAKNRKIHYKQALCIEKFSIVLKRILPDRLYEKLLMKHYKL